MATLTGTYLVNFAAATSHSTVAIQKDIGIIGCPEVRSAEMESENLRKIAN